jgi:serine/threonine-protein phosphatase 2A regulatory subunit B
MVIFNILLSKCVHFDVCLLYILIDKTIKLWKIGQKKIRHALHSPRKRGDLTIPALGKSHAVLRATPRRTYANAHAYHINSISLNSDEETFISSDDLRINWWHHEICDRSFNIVDIKPTNMEELTEVITSTRFHPNHCNILMYSSSRGTIKLADTRSSALCDVSAKVFEETVDISNKSFFSEIIASISDARFSPDGRYILSRDYLSLKIWDVNMESKPVKTIYIHDHLRSMLNDLYESDCIFDKFEVTYSNDGNEFLSGSYNNQFSVWNTEGEIQKSVELPRAGTDSTSNNNTNNKDSMKIKISTGADVQLELEKKLLHCAWNPTCRTVALAAQSSLFLYKV